MDVLSVLRVITASKDVTQFLAQSTFRRLPPSKLNEPASTFGMRLRALTSVKVFLSLESEIGALDELIALLTDALDAYPSTIDVGPEG